MTNTQLADLFLQRLYDVSEAESHGTLLGLNGVAADVGVTDTMKVYNVAKDLHSRGLINGRFNVGNGSVRASITSKGAMFVERGGETGIIRETRQQPLPSIASEKIMRLEDEQYELLGKFVEAHLGTPRESRGTFITTWPHNDQQATFFHSRVQSLRFQGNWIDAEVLARTGLLLKSTGAGNSVTFSVLPEGIDVHEKRRASVAPLYTLSADSPAEFDVFVSHASEDKELIARPLYQALVAKGCKVWFDEAVLKLGDSLRRKIDEGLSKCRYGVVILSPSFFQKDWPQRELDGLVARETASGEKAILPIWHKIDHSGVAAHSPTLADRVAAKSSEGVAAVAVRIIEVLEA